MNNILSRLELYAPAVLRYGMAAVMLWFSFQQFSDASYWTAYVPESIATIFNVSTTTLVYLNATFELVLGILLVVGYQTRIAALLLSLHLFDIMFIVGYGETGVRDFGLALATLVVFMNGPDILCFESKKLLNKY